MNDDRAMLEARAAARIELERRRALTSLTLERLVTDPDYDALDASPVQLALVRAADGKPLDGVLSDDDCIRHFGCGPELIGRERPSIILVRSGVRCGKSRIAASGGALLAALTCPMRRRPLEGERPDKDGLVGLSRGDIIRVPIVAPRLALTKQTFSHLARTLSQPALRGYVVGEPHAESLKIRRPDGYEVIFEIVAASGAGANLRSTWVVAVIFDEADFHNESGAAVNLGDNLDSIRPRLIQGGQIWIPSSPWIEGSEFDELLKRAWGRPGFTLAFHASSREMNPGLPVAAERAMRQENPEKASREYDGLPSPVGSRAFLPPGALTAAVVPALRANNPGVYTTVAAGADLGFRKNSSALVIAAVVGGKIRVVHATERIPEPGKPLSPADVVSGFARTCAAHNCPSMRGDRYSLDATYDELGRTGKILFADGTRREVGYVTIDPTREKQTDLFTRFKRLLVENLVELPNEPRLLAQLRAVESQLMPGGKIVVRIPHDGAAHGDLGMAAVIAVVELEPFVGGRTVAAPPPPIISDWNRQSIGGFAVKPQDQPDYDPSDFDPDHQGIL